MEAAASASKAEEETRDQLYQRAAALGINGRSRMTKSGLAAAIKEHGG
jgi:post-segregation antitoxin (ccd killing protein)